MKRAAEAAAAGNLGEVKEISAIFAHSEPTPAPPAPPETSPDDDVSPREQRLDKARVRIAAFMVVALFAAVGVALLTDRIGSGDTPYVSLLSGLAGIALGWLFATGGSVGGGKKSEEKPVGE